MFFTYSTCNCVDMDIGVVSKTFLYTYKNLFFYRIECEIYFLILKLYLVSADYMEEDSGVEI